MAIELSLENTDDLIKIYDEKSEAWKFVKRDKDHNEQLMIIGENLSRFGLLRNEIRIYLYLARVGERKAGEIAESLALHRTETYRILRDLEKKGIVYSAFEKPLKFTAVPLEKAIDLLIEAQKMRIRLLEKQKTTLVDLWLSMPQPKVENSRKEIFQILEGGQQMILKANELLRRTKSEMEIFVPGDYLTQLYHSDLIDNLERRFSKLNIRLLTENSLKSRFFFDKMGWANHKYRIVDVKNIPCFMISDRNELLITIQKKNEEKSEAKGVVDRKKSRMVALWTNYGAFIETLQTLFNKLDEAGKTVQEIHARSEA